MFQKRQTGGLVYYVSDILEQHGFAHAFFTRAGGVSSGDFASLNVSSARKNHDGMTDAPRNILENYRRALSVLGATPESAVAAHQVHGNTVHTVSDLDAGSGILPFRTPIDCDGLCLTPACEKIRAVTVKTADCVPILLANVRTGAVCAVHAGWRGSAADIVTHAVKHLSDGEPRDVFAAIGASIGKCCYEVGEEVYGAFKSLLRYKGAPESAVEVLVPRDACCSMGGKRHADLAGINRYLLTLCGVPAENVDVTDMCTCCYKDGGALPFFSHRASGGFSGTFISGIATKP